jgi:hypothetical protein
MTRSRFELGIQRLYYVFWACTLVFGIGVLVTVSRERGMRTDDWHAWVGIFVVAPPAMMFAVRWVYRGFLPKATA